MKKIYRCSCCDKVIPIKELCKANEYNERYCQTCTNYLENVAKKWRELNANKP